MTKRIQTYQDLLDEKERLQSLLKVQKEAVHQDFQAIGQELEPVRSAVSFAGKLFTKERGNVLLSASTGTLIDIVIKKIFLSKAGWITRLVVPYFIKNYSSHVNGKGVVRKIFSMLRKKHHSNGQEKVQEDK